MHGEDGQGVGVREWDGVRGGEVRESSVSEEVKVNGEEDKGLLSWEGGEEVEEGSGGSVRRSITATLLRVPASNFIYYLKIMNNQLYKLQ